MEAGNADSLEFYPFAYSLYDENIAHYCWYCLDEQRLHRKCSGCKTAIFCDKDCQQLAWKDHKFECRGIKNTKRVPNIEVRLLGRIVVRYKAILCGKDKEDPNFYTDRTSRRTIMDIWAHTKNILEDQYAMKKFNAIYDELTRFYESRALLSRDATFQLHCRDFINRHAISDRAYLKEIGKGLYLDLCAYDHSCRPNTIYVCDGIKAILRPLNSSVNLLDRSSTHYSYIDLLCGKQERRKLLKDTWYFHCECDRCKDNSEHILTSMKCPNCKPDSPQRLCLFGEHPYKDPQTQLITCPACHEQLSREVVMEALGAMRFIDDMLDKSNYDEMGGEEANRFLNDLMKRFNRLLPQVNIYYCKIVQALIPFIDPQDSRQLLDLHMAVEECIRICYPHNHPALGFHLRNIGIFCARLKNYDAAISYLREALDIFKFVMRDEHSLKKTTQAFLDDALREQREDAQRKTDEPVTEASNTSVLSAKIAGNDLSTSSSSRRRVTVRCEVFSAKSVDIDDADVDANQKTAAVVGKNEEVTASSNVVEGPIVQSDVNRLTARPNSVEELVEEVQVDVVNNRRNSVEEAVEGNLIDADLRIGEQKSHGRKTPNSKEGNRRSDSDKHKSKKTGIKMAKKNDFAKSYSKEDATHGTHAASGKAPLMASSSKKLEISILDQPQTDVTITAPDSSPSSPLRSPSNPLSPKLLHGSHHSHKHNKQHSHCHQKKSEESSQKNPALLSVGTSAEATMAEDPSNTSLFVDTAGGVKKKAAHKKISPRSRTPIPPAAAALRSAAGAYEDDKEDDEIDTPETVPASASSLSVTPTLAVPTIESDLYCQADTSAPSRENTSTSGEIMSTPTTAVREAEGEKAEKSFDDCPRLFDIRSTTTFVQNSRQLCVESITMQRLSDANDGGGDTK